MIGVNIALIENGKILLTKREDFEVWCLPGGHCDAGESLAQTAIRETREEIGLDVRLLNLIGLYSRPHWRNGEYHVALFAAEIVGGDMQMQSGEVIDIRYFGRDALPSHIVMGHRQRCLDALNGRIGVIRTENGKYPFGDEVDRNQLYRLRDESGLSPAEFYMTYFADLDGGDMDVNRINSGEKA